MQFQKFLYGLMMPFALFCTSCIKLKVSPSENQSSSTVKFYGDQYGNFLSTFVPTPDGGYVFGGYTINSNGLEQQGFIQKCNQKGGLEWYQTYGGPKLDLFWVVRPTTDGGYIAAGATTSYGSGANLNYNLQNAYLVKTDSRGNVLWQKTFGGNNGDLFYDVNETSDKGFVAVGSAGGQFYMVKTNQNGDSLWTRSLFKGYSRSYGASVAIGPNGNIAVEAP